MGEGGCVSKIPKKFWSTLWMAPLRKNYSPLLCVRSKLMPCGGMHKFLWNGYSADKWRWDVGAGGVFQRALAPEMASEVVWDDTPVASLLSSRQESTKSFWLPDWKEEDIFFSQNGRETPKILYYFRKVCPIVIKYAKSLRKWATTKSFWLTDWKKDVSQMAEKHQKSYISLEKCGQLS